MKLRDTLNSFAVIVLWSVTMTASAADSSWSVSYVNSRKAEWEQLAGASLRIEGRISLLGSGQMRLSKFEVPIHADEALIRSLQGKKNVEISGQLKKENGKFQFHADRIKVLPTDVQEFESRSSRLRNTNASDWYELGDWAAERSKYYDDVELGKKSLSAYEKAVSAEWRELEADNADGRFQLAAKVSTYKLAETRRMELMHEGNRILCQAFLRAKPDADAAAKLLAKLAKELPGSTTALKEYPADLKKRYEQEPLGVYHESADDVRLKLHRLLYASVAIKPILDDATMNGSNGDVIADRLEKDVPEAKDLVQQYRAQKLAWRVEQSGAATRAEIEQLAADLRAVQQAEQARLVVIQWLKGRESRLREDGPLGLLQLADEYLALLKDEPKAVSFLVEANRIDPLFENVSNKLTSLGYEKSGGVWVRSTGQKPVVPMPDPQQFLPTAIAIGMNATTARLAMGGRPTSVARVVAKGKTSEVWSYGQPGTSRLVIRLETATVPPELRVVDISSER